METKYIDSDSSKVMWKRIKSDFHVYFARIEYIKDDGTIDRLWKDISGQNEDEVRMKVDKRLAKSQWKLKDLQLNKREHSKFLYTGYDHEWNVVYITEVEARTRREAVKLIAQGLNMESYRDKDYQNWKRIFIESKLDGNELGKVF